jgi:hypothetical protein
VWLPYNRVVTAMQRGSADLHVVPPGQSFSIETQFIVAPTVGTYDNATDPPRNTV